VRELDELRKASGHIEPYPKPTGNDADAAEERRIYYLLDASVLVHLYVPDEQIIPQIDHLLEQRGLQKAFLYVPNFCVAETFNSIARKHYREGALSEATYRKCKEAFAHDIHNGQLFYHHELNRYHILNADYIIPFEHLFPSERADGTERRLSTFDVLIIAMGMELTRITTAWHVGHLERENQNAPCGVFAVMGNTITKQTAFIPFYLPEVEEFVKGINDALDSGLSAIGILITANQLPRTGAGTVALVCKDMFFFAEHDDLDARKLMSELLSMDNFFKFRKEGRC
jgi:hypothetical protein